MAATTGAASKLLPKEKSTHSPSSQYHQGKYKWSELRKGWTTNTDGTIIWYDIGIGNLKRESAGDDNFRPICHVINSFFAVQCICTNLVLWSTKTINTYIFNAIALDWGLIFHWMIYFSIFDLRYKNIRKKSTWPCHFHTKLISLTGSNHKCVGLTNLVTNRVTLDQIGNKRIKNR